MLELNKGHIRVLYIIAKAGEPIRKKRISHATARWNAANRNRVLSDLERGGLVITQPTPASHQKPAGRYYWLTPNGIETVQNLEDKGKIQTLPANWRESYA